MNKIKGFIATIFLIFFVVFVFTMLFVSINEEREISFDEYCELQKWCLQDAETKKALHAFLEKGYINHREFNKIQKIWNTKQQRELKKTIYEMSR